MNVKRFYYTNFQIIIFEKDQVIEKSSISFFKNLKVSKVLKLSLEDFKYRILHNGSLSNPNPCQAGVRQGCILSPQLFLIALDEVLTHY